LRKKSLLSDHITRKKEKKGENKGISPIFPPTPTPHPTQEITPKKKITPHNITQ
jgi:hypothetical protein